MNKCPVTVYKGITVEFSDPVYSTFESTGVLRAALVSSLPLSTAYQIRIRFSSGNATRNVDFTSTPLRLRFPAGVTRVNFTVPIIVDGIFEGTESFNLRLDLTPGAQALQVWEGDQNTAVGRIIDQGINASFNQALYIVNEPDGPARPTLVLSNPSSTNITVQVFTTDGTATGGDYGSGVYNVTIPAGVINATFDIPITDDVICELNESFLVAIDPSSLPADVTVHGQATVTIINDDICTQLRCDHPLRVLQPNRFKHCTCFYGAWSDWTRIGNSMSSGNCDSGYAYQVKRIRKDNLGKCPQESQKQYQCEATTKEKAQTLILALGLVKQQRLSDGSVIIPANISISKRSTCSSTRICGNKRSLGRRSAIAEETPSEIDEANFVQLEENIIPEPFNLEMELSHIKAHRLKRQDRSSDDKYFLYILDSSGSIGHTNFKDMKDVVAEFSLFYCTDTKVAVMSYSDYVYKDYCFNCDQTNVITRYNAIKAIPYHSRYTASGDAIQCACDYMLNSPCGFSIVSGQNAPEVTVVFITDGKSNRGKNVCTAANCWSNIYNINVFPIGIGNSVDYNELNCIKGNIANKASQFNLKDFKELLELLKEVKQEAEKNDKCI